MELCLGGFRRKLFYRLSYNWRFADFLSVLICIIVNGLMWLFGPLLGNVYPLDVVGGPLKKALIDSFFFFVLEGKGAGRVCAVQ